MFIDIAKIVNDIKANALTLIFSVIRDNLEADQKQLISLAEVRW